MKHPAKFSEPILRLMRPLAQDCDRILDPFAGTGRVHLLGRSAVGVEIEPEWACLHPRTIVGDALALPFAADSFDGVFTSPTYANRMADHHDARDSSKRNTYKHTLGRNLHPNNSGQLQWGRKYRRFHIRTWREVRRVLQPGGLFVLNVSDHIRKGEVVPVAEWHNQLCRFLGFKSIEHITVRTRRNGQGANGKVRVASEVIHVFEAPEKSRHLRVVKDSRHPFWDVPGPCAYGAPNTRRPFSELFAEWDAR